MKAVGAKQTSLSRIAGNTCTCEDFYLSVPVSTFTCEYLFLVSFLFVSVLTLGLATYYNSYHTAGFPTAPMPKPRPPQNAPPDYLLKKKGTMTLLMSFALYTLACVTCSIAYLGLTRSLPVPYLLANQIYFTCVFFTKN
jgi:hypothetical protein